MDLRLVALAVALVVGAIALLRLLAPELQTAFTFEPVVLPHGLGLDLPGLRLDPPPAVRWIRTEDAHVLHGWDIPPQAGVAGTTGLGKTLVFFHGNSGNLQSYAAHLARSLHEGYRVVAFDYSGFGLSSGEATEEAFYADVRAVLAYLESTTPGGHAQVVVHGYSIGCAAAVYAVAASDDFAALVLEAPFDDFKQAALTYFPLLAPLAPFITPSFPNADRVRAIAATPLLVIHSRGDEVVHFASGVRVFEAAASSTKHFIQAPGGHEGVHCDHAAYAWVARAVAARTLRVVAGTPT